MGEAATTEKTLDNVFDALTGKGIQPGTPGAPGQAPAQIGKAIFEKDYDNLKSLGYGKIHHLFGSKDPAGDSAPALLPVNFGSKSACGDLPTESRLRLLNLKKIVNNLEVQAGIQFKNQHITPAMMESMPYYKEVVAPRLKAFNITDFSSWIPTVNARFYFEEYQLPFLLADIFDQLPMDSATVNVPGDIGHLEGVEETDAATFTAQFTAQDNYTVYSRNNVVHAQITEDLLSDSAPAYIEKLRRDVLMGIARAYERAIINGDTAGSPRGASHQDSDTAALALNQTFAKAFNGIRKKAFDNEALQGSTGKVVYNHSGDAPSKVMFETVMSLMGKFASEKDDLAWLVSSSVENKLVTGAIPELFTAFAFGGLASNVTGQCPPVFGIKVLTSQFVREDLNATGVYQSGETKTHIALIKKSRFANYVRQAIRVWAAPSLPSSDIMLMSAKMRHAWAGNNQKAAEMGITMAVNVKTV